MCVGKIGARVGKSAGSVVGKIGWGARFNVFGLSAPPSPTLPVDTVAVPKLITLGGLIRGMDEFTPRKLEFPFVLLPFRLAPLVDIDKPELGPISEETKAAWAAGAMGGRESVGVVLPF